LTVQFTATGQNAVESALKSTQKALSGVGNAATAPIKALAGVGKALGSVATIAAGAAIGGGLAQLPGAMLDMAKGAAADEQATARLQQTLRTLPGDFNKMVGAVDAAIASGQKLAFSDDDVRDSFQFLAQATGTAEEGLKRQKVAMDLARGAGIPLAQASKLVGKVNEENVDTFKKLGINIKEGASEAEALAAIQGKFAGQAEAYATSTAGQFEQAQIAVSEIQESIGSALLPVLATVGKALADNLPAIQAFVGAFSSGIAGVIAPALEKIGPLLSNLFGPLLTTLPDLGTAISQAFSFFTTGTGDIEKFRGVLNSVFGPDATKVIIDVFTNLSSFFRETVIPMFQSFADIVGKVMKGDFAGALDAALKHIETFAPKLVTQLIEWGKAFLEWVGPLIPPLLAELAKLAARLLAWLAEKVPQVIEQLAAWAAAFIDWVGPKIPPLLAELGKLAAALFNWIVTTALPELLTKLAEWAVAFVEWVGPRIIPLLIELGKLLLAIANWFATEAMPKVNELILKLSERFWKWVGEKVLPEIGPALARLWEAIQTWLTETASNVWEGIAGAGSQSLKNRMLMAFDNAISSAVTAVNGWIDNLIEPFRRAWRTIKDLLDKIRGGRSEAEQPVGGGGGHVQALGRGMSVVVNNTIDARGMSPAGVTRAVGDDLAFLMRTRLIAGVA
jgi:hypothetical protein